MSDSFLHPEVEWVDDRCYRKLPIKGSTKKPHYEEEDKYPVGLYEYVNVEKEDEEINLPIKHEGNKFFIGVPIPGSLVGYIAGKKLANKKTIEEQTDTRITLPSRHIEIERDYQDKSYQDQNYHKKTQHKKWSEPKEMATKNPYERAPDGEIVIEGMSKKAVHSAYCRIQQLAKSGRDKLSPTHFISMPVNNASVREGYLQFKKDVLSSCQKDRGVREYLFQPPMKLHLTLCMLTLLDGRDKERATEVMQRAKDRIMSVLHEKPLHVEVRGIEYMNDDPAEVTVLYGQVHEIDHDNRLQLIANLLADSYAESGLSSRQGDSVKLHVTLLKSASKQEIRETFDARTILKKYEKYVFGKTTINQIHISVRYTEAKDGYYIPNYCVSF